MLSNKCLQTGCQSKRSQATALSSLESPQELGGPDEQQGSEVWGVNQENAVKVSINLDPQILSSLLLIELTGPPPPCQDSRGFVFHGKGELFHTRDARPRGSGGEGLGNKGLSTHLYVGA